MKDNFGYDSLLPSICKRQSIEQHDHLSLLEVELQLLHFLKVRRMERQIRPNVETIEIEPTRIA
jgi:hypothetical protein